MTQAGIVQDEITESAGTSSASRHGDDLRADAQRNHERILAVARHALAASADVSLNSIAKRAGVGPGTLYRHFPSREALVLAVYEEEVQALVDNAAELLTQHQPLQALRLWLDRVAAYGATKHSLADALSSATSSGQAEATYGPIVGALAQLVSACQLDGGIQADIEPEDVLLLLAFVWRIQPGPNAHARVARLVELIMAGMQADASRSSSQPRTRRARRLLRRPRRLALIRRSPPRSR